MSAQQIMPRKEIAQATAPEGAARILIGTWELVDATFNEQTKDMRGEHPVGMIVYDANGYVTTQISPGRALPIPDSYPLSADAAYTALRGFGSYFGTYEVDWENGLVRHYPSFIMPPMPTDSPLVRRFEVVDEDHIILTALESNHVLRWRRLK